MNSLNIPESIKSRWRWIAAAFGIIILTLSVWYAFSNNEPPMANQEPTLALPEGIPGKVGEVMVTEEALKLAEIQTAPADVRSVRDEIMASGTVKTGGNQIAKITPHISGEVIEILVLPGAMVEEGQVLAKLSSPELARAQANYRRAAALVNAMQADLNRKRKLAELGQYGSAELENSRSNAVEAERGLFQAKRSVAERKAELAEAESNLEVLTNRLTQAEAELKVERAHYNRAKSLPELLSLQQLERIQADYEKAQAEVATAKSRIIEGKTRVNTARSALTTVEGEQPLAERELTIRKEALAREEQVFTGGYSRNRELIEAESDLEMALIDLNGAAEEVKLLGGTPGGTSDTIIHSPIAGKVEEATLALGEHVETEDLCFTVINLDQVWAELAVAPKDISKIEVGDKVELRADASPEQSYQALVTSVGSRSDPTTKTVPVLATVLNTGGRLATGSYVKGTITTETRQERLTVPKGALQEHTGRATLYVAKPEQKGLFEVRHVTLGVEGDGWREIAEGLNPDEPLATDGTFYLKSEALKSALSDGCCAVGE